MRKKKLISMFLALCMVPSLVACGSGSSDTSEEATEKNTEEAAVEKEDADTGDAATENDGDEIVLKFLGCGGETDQEVYDEIFATYYELTGVKIEAELYAYSDYIPAVETKMSGQSDMYDIIDVNCCNTAAYAAKGYILSLDDYYTADEKDQITSAAVNEGSYNGTFYSAAKNTSAQVLYYNKDLLKEAGIEIPEADPDNRVTWEQIYDWAEQGMAAVDPDGSKGIYGIMFEQAQEMYQMLALPNSLGEASIGDDGFTVDGVVNTEGWLKAMTYISDVFNNGLSVKGVDYGAYSGYFNSGKALFMVGGTWNVNYFDGDFEWGYTYHPAWEGYNDTVATPTGSWHLGVSAYSKNAEAAAEFVKYITIGEGNKVYIEGMGQFPCLKTTLDEMMNKPSDESDMQLAVNQLAAYDVLNTAFPRPTTPAFNEYNTLMNTAFIDVENGIDPEEALSNFVEEFNYLAETYK